MSDDAAATARAAHIRPAVEPDAARLAALYRDAYGELAARGFPSSAAETTAADVREWLASRECWVAVDDADVDSDGADTDADEADTDGADAETADRIVGAVQLRERPEWPCPEVCRLAVDPAVQGAGLGGRLLAHVERVVRERGGERLRLRSFSGHPFLLRWYRDRGYEQVGLQRLADRPFDAPVLERRL